MRNKIKNVALLVIGMFLGATLFGGVAFAATGVMAERSTNRVFVDGREIILDAYLIDGNNYVKLRDVAQAVNFNTYWDGTVQIDSTAPYTGEAPALPAPISEPDTASLSPAGTMDYSINANPNTFSGVYTREAYNAAFTVLDGLKRGDVTVTAALHIPTQEDRWKLEGMLGYLCNGYTLSLRGIEGQGMYEIFVVKPDREIARQYTADLIAEVNSLDTDRDKVIRLNEYLCEKMRFDPDSFAGMNLIASSVNPVSGNCVSFAAAMNELCAKVGVPCLMVSGEGHRWNLIYTDGRWAYTDVCLNAQTESHDYMLFSDSTRKQIADPAGIRFLQELLIPGSTN